MKVTKDVLKRQLKKFKIYVDNRLTKSDLEKLLAQAKAEQLRANEAAPKAAAAIQMRFKAIANEAALKAAAREAIRMRFKAIAKEAARKAALLPEGKFIVSFNLKLVIKDKGYTTKKVTEIVEVKDKTQQELINDITLTVLEKAYNNSEIEVLAQTHFKMTPVEDKKIDEIRNRNHKSLQYKIFPELERSTPGQCVIDMVVVAMQKYYKLFTRPRFIKEMKAVATAEDENFEKNGICVRHLLSWAKTYTDVSMFALDPFFKVFKYHVAKDCKVRISFCVNNEHVYPIRNEDYLNQISHLKMLNFNAPLLSHGSDDSEYVLFDTALQKAIDNTDFKANVIHVETDDLSEVLYNMIKKTGYAAVGISFNQSKVTSFQHPLKDQIFIASEDYLHRKQLFETLFAHSNYVDFSCWKNQSWASIWNSWIEFRVGELPKSSYNSRTLEMFSTYPMSGYIGMTREVDELPNIKSFDICKCYTSCCIENEHPFAIDSMFDEVEEFHDDPKFSSESLPVGHAYISKAVMLGHQRHSLGWYPSFFVDYLIENGLTLDAQKLSYRDVTYIQRASNTLRSDIFKQPVLDLLALHPKAKKVINSGIGAYGTRSKKSGNVSITDSAEMALAMITKDKNIKLSNMGSMWFLRKETKEPLLKSNISIRNHIVCMGHIKLHQLEQKVCGPSTEVICFNTDSIKVINPVCTPVEKDMAKPGDFCQESTVNIRGSIISQMKDRPEYKHVELTHIEINKAEAMLDPCSFIVMAPPGTGKSHTLETLYDTYTKAGLKVLKLAWTKTAALRVNGETIDHVFPKENTKSWMQIGAAYDVIMVDEFSFLPPEKFINLFVPLKMFKKDLIFQFYGDPNQLHAMNDDNKMWYAYEKSSVMHFLTDSKVINLSYVSAAARYDDNLKNKLDLFFKNKTLDSFKSRLFTPSECDFSIVKNPTSRAKVNAKWVAYYSKGKNVTFYKNWKLWDGMYLISHDNDKDIVNSVRYHVTKVDKENQTVTINSEFGEKVITFEQINQKMRYGYCDTVMRMQARTVHGKFNIFEIDEMEWNDAFVALSRATTESNIGMTIPKKTFQMAVPPMRGREIKIVPDYFEGVIYKRTDGEKTYIGSTNNLKRREKEHQETPVSKKVLEWEKENGHKIVMTEIAKYVCLTRNQLLNAEYREISKIPKELCMNTAHCEAVAKNTTKYNEKIEIDYSRFKITDDVEKKRFRIRWRENGKEKDKEFSYLKVKKEDAMARATEFRAELTKKFFI